MDLSDEEKPKLATDIDQKEKALALLDPQKPSAANRPLANAPYELTEAENELVRARYDGH